MSSARSFLLGALIVGASSIASLTSQAASATTQDKALGKDPSVSRRTSIVAAAQRVGPAVVTISVVQTRMVQSSPFSSEFFEPFFRDMMPSYRYREQIPSMGS